MKRRHNADDKRLHVLINGDRIGWLEQDVHGDVRFRYDDAWVNAGRHALSLSMPTARALHGKEESEAFFWNLLPDNPAALDEIAKRQERGGPCSPQSLFRMIAKAGMDCPGALQVVREEDLEEAVHGGEILPISEAQIAQRLRDLQRRPALTRDVNRQGQFSLPGAQPKTAYIKTENGWAEPSGRYATTHIFKPANPAFDGLIEIEHVCLETARRLGMIVARSEILHFEDMTAIVVERYDRKDGIRIHQEDFCQANAVPHTRKYEYEGGPGIAAILRNLDASNRPQEDRTRFWDAIILNWLLLGTDAHAKNYSLLIADSGLRLAPLYDIASYYPFAGHDPQRLTMKIGGQHYQRDILPRHWQAVAKTTGENADRLIERIREMARNLPDALGDAIKESIAKDADHCQLDTLLHEAVAFCKWVVSHYDVTPNGPESKLRMMDMESAYKDGKSEIDRIRKLKVIKAALDSRRVIFQEIRRRVASAANIAKIRKVGSDLKIELRDALIFSDYSDDSVHTFSDDGRIIGPSYDLTYTPRKRPVRYILYYMQNTGEPFRWYEAEVDVQGDAMPKYTKEEINEILKGAHPTMKLARPPDAIDGGGLNAFCERWIAHLVEAAEGNG